MILNRATHFYNSVDTMVKGGSSVMESVLEYCEKHGLEVESIVPLVTKNANLTSRLREEAESMNSVEKVTRLPI